MLQLSKKTKLAEGTSRTVHLVPGEKDLLVKVELFQKVRKTRIFKKLYNSLFPVHTRIILREIKEDMRVQLNAHLLGIKSPIAPTRGLVQTSKGLGLLVDRIGTKSHGLAPTLKSLKYDNKLDATKLKHLNHFTKAMFDTGVITNDLQTQNIVWDDATESFLLIDGFGERNLIKVKTYIPFVRNRKQNIWFKHIANKLDIKWLPKERKFSFNQEIN